MKNKAVILFLIAIGIFTSPFAGAVAKSKSQFVESNLLNIWLPNIAVHGSPFFVFVKPVTSFDAPQGLRLVLRGYLDSDLVDLQSMSDELWWYKGGSSLVQGTHYFLVDFILENAGEADSIRSEITRLQQEIKDLEVAIAISEDDAERAILQAQLDQKIVDESALNESIKDTQLLVTTEYLIFEIL